MSTDRNIFVINNPTSGGRSKNQRITREAKEFLTLKGISHSLFETTPAQNAQKIVESRFDSSFNELLIIGGDGTINESVNGLKADVPVSIIPAGTGNDFVKNVNIGKKLEDHLETVNQGSIQSIDLGICNGRKFVNGIGIGFDGQIVEDMKAKKIPFLKGHTKYYYHVLSILASYKERKFDFHLDGSDHSNELILMTVGNGTTFGGGFKLMPNAKIDDGLLEVCTIGPISAFRRFLNITKLSNGSHGVLPEVNFHQASEVKIDAHLQLFAHLDGEAIGQPPFHIRVEPGALKIRCVLTN